MIQICLLTYNRNDLIGRAIRSILSQNIDNYQLIISDNSTNNDTQSLIQEQFHNEPRLTYKKRTPSLPPIVHFNAVLSEVTAEYFILFHDDDIMHPEMLHVLFEKIRIDNSVAAIGCNAYIVKNGRKVGIFRKAQNHFTTIANRSELIEQYLGKHGCVPFPSYIYRKTNLEGVFMDVEKGGKYCDVSFLMSVCDRGKLIWLKEPLMDYYIHDGQDSKSDNFSDRLKLIRHITSTTVHHSKSNIIKAYRLLNIYGELKKRILTDKKLGHGRLTKTTILALFYSPTKVFPRMIYLFYLKLSLRPSTCRQ